MGGGELLVCIWSEVIRLKLTFTIIKVYMSHDNHKAKTYRYIKDKGIQAYYKRKSSNHKRETKKLQNSQKTIKSITTDNL